MIKYKGEFMNKLTTELIAEMTEHSISIHRIMVGITEEAVVDLDADEDCLDDMSYDVLDSAPPLSHYYEVRYRGEPIYDKVGASDEEIIEFITKLIAKRRR